MALPQRQKQQDIFTYAEYMVWPDDERWEIIGGEAFAMTPAPGLTHQHISTTLTGFLFMFFAEHPCQFFHAPFDVRLPENDETPENASNVVQPDIVVYCDASKLDERGGKGAPDLVVEILSPSTANRDLIDKMALYERHGVREYWVIDPVHQIVTLYTPDKNKKFTCEKRFARQHKLKSSIFPKLHIDLKKVFPPLPGKKV